MTLAINVLLFCCFHYFSNHEDMSGTMCPFFLNLVYPIDHQDLGDRAIYILDEMNVIRADE